MAAVRDRSATSERVTVSQSFFCVYTSLTAVTDGWCRVSLVDALFRFTATIASSGWGWVRSRWTCSLAVIVTSLLRVRLGVTAWRGVHWLAYVAWPIALAHGLGIGTDSGRPWMLVITAVCIGSVLVALAFRLTAPTRLAGRHGD